MMLEKFYDYLIFDNIEQWYAIKNLKNRSDVDMIAYSYFIKRNILYSCALIVFFSFAILLFSLPKIDALKASVLIFVLIFVLFVVFKAHLVAIYYYSFASFDVAFISNIIVAHGNIKVIFDEDKNNRKISPSYPLIVDANYMSRTFHTVISELNKKKEVLILQNSHFSKHPHVVVEQSLDK